MQSVKHPNCSLCRRELTPDARARKGMCFRCYQRERRGRSLVGKRCAVCSVEDQRVLQFHRMAEGHVVLCANHATIAGKRSITLDELKDECFPAGDRRQEDRRRSDRRNYRERRQDDWHSIDDEERRSYQERRAG